MFLVRASVRLCFRRLDCHRLCCRRFNSRQHSAFADSTLDPIADQCSSSTVSTGPTVPSVCRICRLSAMNWQELGLQMLLGLSRLFIVCAAPTKVGKQPRARCHCMCICTHSCMLHHVSTTFHPSDFCFCCVPSRHFCALSERMNQSSLMSRHYLSSLVLSRDDPSTICAYICSFTC